MPASHAVPGAVVATLGAGTNIIGKVYITDGTDNALVSATGELSTLDTNSAAIKTAVQLIDNAVAADGVAAVAGLLQVGGTDGTNAQILSVSNTGILNVADGGGSITVDSVGFGIRAISVSTDTIGAHQAGVWNIGTVGTLTTVTNNVGANLYDGGGTALTSTTVASDRALDINLVQSVGLSAVVTATDLDIRNLAPATDSVKVNDGTTDLTVAVNTAAAKVAGIQMMAMYDATIPTATTDGYAVTPLADAYGVLQTTGHVGNAFRAAQNQSTAQTNTELVATPGANLSLYITDIIISNGATAGNVKLVESTADTPLDIVEVEYFAVNGGLASNFQTPLKLTANKNLGYTSVDVTTHSITVSGYIAP